MKVDQVEIKRKTFKTKNQKKIIADKCPCLTKLSCSPEILYFIQLQSPRKREKISVHKNKQYVTGYIETIVMKLGRKENPVLLFKQKNQPIH